MNNENKVGNTNDNISNDETRNTCKYYKTHTLYWTKYFLHLTQKEERILKKN